MFRPKGISYTIAAAALFMTPAGANGQETAPLEPVVSGQEDLPVADSVVAPVSNVSFEEVPDLANVDVSDFRFASPTEDQQSLSEAQDSEDFYSDDDVVVTGTRRAPLQAPVPEQFTEHEFNAGMVRIFDDYLSIRGDSTTLSLGDGGNLFDFRWRWDDTDGENEGYADRDTPEIEEEPDYLRRR